MKITKIKGKASYVDLGEDVYSATINGVQVQTKTLLKIKCKGGMRDCFVCPDGYVWISEDYCLDPNSLILTKNGSIPMKDIQDGMLVYTPWGYKQCRNVRYTGKKKVIKIKLKTGEVLRCSSEHRVCVKRDGIIKWIKAGDIKNTDYIFSINNTKYLEDNGITPECIPED